MYARVYRTIEAMDKYRENHGKKVLGRFFCSNRDYADMCRIIYTNGCYLHIAVGSKEGSLLVTIGRL